MPKPILHAYALSRWITIRQRLGLSTNRALARRFGVSPATVFDLQQKINAGQWPVRSPTWEAVVSQLARTFHTDTELESWAAPLRLAWPPALWQRLQTQIHTPVISEAVTQRCGSVYLSRPGLEHSLLTRLLSTAPLPGETLPRRGGVVTGLSGVGKTALVANTLREHSGALNQRFTEGLYWLDLETHSLEEAVSDWAHNLGVTLPHTAHSHTLDWSALRTHLRTQAVLVIVDGADAAAVTSLLNLVDSRVGRVVCLVRERLPDPLLRELRLWSLTVEEWSLTDSLRAWPLYLERPLMPEEVLYAQQVYARIGGLPMALELAAEQVVLDGHWARVLATLEHQPLSALTADESEGRPARLRGSLEARYQQLQATVPEAAHCFRVLGLLKSGVFLGAFWSAGMGLDDATLTHALRRLQREYWVTSLGADWYRVSPLARAYAREQLRQMPDEYAEARARYMATYLNPRAWMWVIERHSAWGVEQMVEIAQAFWWSLRTPTGVTQALPLAQQLADALRQTQSLQLAMLWQAIVSALQCTSASASERQAFWQVIERQVRLPYRPSSPASPALKP